MCVNARRQEFEHLAVYMPSIGDASEMRAPHKASDS